MLQKAAVWRTASSSCTSFSQQEPTKDLVFVRHVQIPSMLMRVNSLQVAQRVLAGASKPLAVIVSDSTGDQTTLEKLAHYSALLELPARDPGVLRTRVQLAPWMWTTDRSEISMLRTAKSGILLVVDAITLTRMTSPWPLSSGVSIKGFIGGSLQAGSFGYDNPAELDDALEHEVATEIATRALAELRELTAQAVTQSPNGDAASLAARIGSIRLRHREVEITYQASGNHSAVLKTLLESSTRDADTLSQLLNLNELRRLQRYSIDVEAAVRSSREFEERRQESAEARERVADRRVAFVASIFVLPSVWFGYLGVSGRATTLWGVEIGSDRGQLLIVAVAALMSLVSFLILLITLERKAKT